MEFINCKDLTEENINKIRNICISSIDDIDHNLIHDNFYYENLKRYDDTWVILGDDWYFLLSITELNIDFMEFYATKRVNPKRLKEMYACLKFILKNYKGLVCGSTLRHNTTYKLYQFLVKKGYLTKIGEVVTFNKEIDENKELLKRYEEGTISKENLEYIMHDVGFLIGSMDDIKSEEIFIEQKKWLILNQYIKE